MERIIVAGATGFIGHALIPYLQRHGYHVTTVGRDSRSNIRWTERTALRKAVDGSRAVINLAGKSINCRYNAKNRRAILQSRITTTRSLSDTIQSVVTPPSVWLNASSATIYPHAMEHPYTEDSVETGSGFSVDVVKRWEHELLTPELPETRRIAMRTSLVLGNGGGVFPVFSTLSKFGLGGPHIDGYWPSSRRRRRAGTDHHYGTRHGDQHVSWIHIEDMIRAMRFVITHEGLDGPANFSSPHPTTDRQFMAAIRSEVGRPFGLPLYRWMMEPGAVVLRTESELLYKSMWVLPKRLTDAGFTFRYPDLPSVLAALSK